MTSLSPYAYATPSQILWRSVKTAADVDGDLSICQNGGYPPSWICCTHAKSRPVGAIFAVRRVQNWLQ